MNQEKQEFWATIELFGHGRLAGLVSEHQLGGASFVRVDVPETRHQPSFSKLLNHSAIYAITPVDESMARLHAQQISAKPLEAFELNRMLEKKLEMDGVRLINAKEEVFPRNHHSPDDDDDDDDNFGPDHGIY